MKLNLVEPSWGKEVLDTLNLIANNDTIKPLIPIFADGVVFLYPVFLVLWYLLGGYIVQKSHKKYAILTFLGVIASILITLFIQQFVDKARPENFLNQDMLVLKHFPSISFPSDHATVGFAMAFGIIRSWSKLKNKWLKISWYIFLILAVLMGLARIGAWVHWPTDILAGMVVALLWVELVFKNEDILAKFVNFLIWLEEKVLGIVFQRFEKY